MRIQQMWQTGRMTQKIHTAGTLYHCTILKISTPVGFGPFPDLPGKVRQETAALRNFNPAYARFGSIASDRHARDAPPMSAMDPIATELWHRSETSLRAITGHMHRSKKTLYSITSSARASSVGGISRPMARAVGRLITSSNLLDWTTGRSAGLAPLRTLPL